MNKNELSEIIDVREELEAEKQPYVETWKSIIRYIGLAYDKWPDCSNIGGRDTAPRYYLTDTTASTASDMLANGVEGYACSSSLQWFDYGIEDIGDEASRDTARSLLEKVKKVVYMWLQKSNYYPTFRSVVRSGADLGTGGCYFQMNERTGLPVFSVFHLADIETMTDEYGVVDTVYRKIWLTRKEAERHFPDAELPRRVLDSKKPRERFLFYQMISPVLKWDFDIPGDGDYISIYWSDDDREKVIREERIAERPFAIFRWEEPVFGGPWGVDSPGQLSLAAMRFVNELQEDVVTLSELVAKGHWKKTKGLKVNFRAGGVTELNPGEDFALTQATGDLSWLAEHIAYYRAVINDCYKTNLFLTLTNNIDRTKTATEVQGLTQERETLMQSFWSRLANQFFEPLHEWLYLRVLKSGKLTDITKDELDALRDLDMRIDYISPAYMAQKRAFELGPSMSWISDAVQLAQVNPNILDKVNFDAFLDLDAVVRNAKQEIVISSEDAQRAREIRANAEAAMANQAAEQEALKNASDAYGKLTKRAEDGSAAQLLLGTRAKES